VDRHSLLRLANTGLASLPPSRLGDLASSCWDFGEASADARYFVLWRVFNDLADEFRQFEAVRVDAVSRVDAALAEFLPEIVAEDDNEAATALAVALRRRIQEDRAL
jgi:hypothetical protein